MEDDNDGNEKKLHESAAYQCYLSTFTSGEDVQPLAIPAVGSSETTRDKHDYENPPSAKLPESTADTNAATSDGKPHSSRRVSDRHLALRADDVSVSTATRIMIAPPPLVRHETQPGAVAVAGPGSTRSISCTDSLMDSTVVSIMSRERSSSYDDRLWGDVLINAVLVEEEEQAPVAISQRQLQPEESNRDMPFVEATPMMVPKRPWFARWCVTSSLLLATCIIVAIVVALTTDGGTITSLRSPPGPPPQSPTSAPITTPSPTMSPSSSGLVDVAIAIQLDENPDETGWSLTCDLETLEEVLPGTYGNDRRNGTLVTIRKVNLGDECVFTIVDSGSDGIVEGWYELYLGDDITDIGKRMVFGTGDFEDNARVPFVVEAPATVVPSSAPSIQPTTPQASDRTLAPTIVPSQTPTFAPTSIVPITVVIRLDGNPGETSWRLKCGERTVYNVPPRNYEGQQNRLITVPALLAEGEECEFTIFDDEGNGLDGGYFELYAGEDILDSKTRIAGGAGNFGTEKTVPFQVIAPPDEPPVSTPAPTVSETDVVAVTLDLQLDKFPSETGWLLECDGAVKGYVPPTAYVEQYQRITHTLYLQEGAHCKLRITDTYGDGLCCRFGSGYFRLYLAEDTSDESSIIVEVDTFRFVEEHFFQVAVPEPSPSPTTPSSPVPTVQAFLEASVEPEFTQVPITIVIKLDEHPLGIEWSLECDDTELANISEGAYVESSQVIMNTFEVDEGAECVFIITDAFGEGISGEGFFQIHLSDMTSINDESLLHEGRGFGFREEFEFKVNLSS